MIESSQQDDQTLPSQSMLEYAVSSWEYFFPLLTSSFSFLLLSLSSRFLLKIRAFLLLSWAMCLPFGEHLISSLSSTLHSKDVVAPNASSCSLSLLLTSGSFSWLSVTTSRTRSSSSSGHSSLE